MRANLSEEFDIAIVGGGMVGASLAVALAGLNLRLALIEAVAHDSSAQPSFDERTTALSNGSRRILETIGVWNELAPNATPIRKIHVSDRGRFGFARIDAAELGLNELGHVVPNRHMGAALWRRLAELKAVHIQCPANVTHIDPGDATTVLEFETSGVVSSLSARMVVAADGAHSAVRAAFGIGAESRSYEQTAVITSVLPQKFHEFVAYERFTDSGPLALLPLADGRCTLVLTLSPELAIAALGWSDDEFLAETQRRFGFRLGRFIRVGRRTPYPLSLTRSLETSSGRCLVVGNAAQGLHPVAGMGFNLGLRDVATLAELIADARAVRSGSDWATGLAPQYDAWRHADRAGVIGFTDGLVRIFGNPLETVRRVRNAGLLAFDLLPFAKAALSRLSTGATARIPKLARGVALR